MKTTHMKNLPLFLFALFIVNCSEDPLNNQRDDYFLDSEVSIQMDRSASLHTMEGRQFTVTQTNIADSRCPINANCVWAGNATVGLVISQEADSVALELCIGQCGKGFTERDTVSFSLHKNNYYVILKAVEPYPDFTDQDSREKKAILEFYMQ